jgi:hypothetical protein
MLEQVKILSSRRAYEFRPDDLRLTMLSIKPVQEQIQQLFHFQLATMGTPIATFGDVPLTYPPGFVFNMGSWLSPDRQPVPIRFLHFEQRRIVIDVSGSSSAIDAIFEQLQHFLSELQAPDRSPVIGEPERILDYSEITARFQFSLDAFFVPPLRKLFTRATGASARSKGLVLVPTVVIKAHPHEQELPAIVAPNDFQSFTFALRGGTRPEEKIYCSSAPLDSEAHLAYLTELDAALTS